MISSADSCISQRSPRADHGHGNHGDLTDAAATLEGAEPA
jgi:hypothetical protein